MDSVAGAGEQRSECFSGIIEELDTGDSVGVGKSMGHVACVSDNTGWCTTLIVVG